MLIVIPKYDLWLTYPQLGPLYIASILRQHGENVQLIDAVAERNFFRSLDEKIINHKTVGISANISHACSGKETALYIRKNYPDRKIIWGGPYPSCEYKSLIPELADIVVIGEGEEQIADISKGKSLDEIPGIAYWDKNSIKVNEREKYIENLDSLPFPDWDLVDSLRYNHPGLKPGYVMVTERGCPFDCINCTKFIHGNKYRTRSVKNVLDEIELLAKNFHCREIHFWDDNFTLQPERVKKICGGIIERKLNSHIRFAVPGGIRADINDEEMFELMRQAGFYYVSVAIESGDQKTIERIGKKLDLEKVPQTVNTLYKKGFRIGLFFMMGFPFDTPESLNKTVEFAASLPAHHAHFFMVTPLPGTKLYEMIPFVERYDKKLISYDKEDLRFNNQQLPHKVIMRYHHLAYRRFYGSPRRIFRIICALWKEGILLNDLCLLLKNGIRILICGHR